MPLFVRNKDNSLITVAERFRIQRGPRRIVAVASEETLSDEVTAKHYYAGVRKVKTRDGAGRVKMVEKVGIDCRGEPIEIGKEFEYVDWRGRNRNPVWTVFEHVKTDEILMNQGPMKGRKILQERWLSPKDYFLFDSEDAALENVLERLGISPRAAMGEEMVFLADAVLDGALDVITDAADRFDICSQEPTTYTEATSTYTLGNKDHGAAGSAWGAPGAGDVSGRKIASTAVTDGSVTGTDTATHWATTDVGATTLYATQSLSSSQAVTSGNTWAMPSLDIEFPDPS